MASELKRPCSVFKVIDLCKARGEVEIIALGAKKDFTNPFRSACSLIPRKLMLSFCILSKMSTKSAAFVIN